MLWLERSVPEASIDALVAAGYPRLLARLLALRQVTPETAAAYFMPTLRDLASPTDLPGISEAAEVVLGAVRAKRKIVVFGDYDCDGICATALLVRTLEALGATVVPFLPDRLTEGYGMNDKSIARLLTEQPDAALIVTVDNGINSVEQVADLKTKGKTVVVTDHHLPGSVLPDCPIVNPKVAAPDTLTGLCGAGVAFLLANAVIDRAKAEGLYTGANLAAPLIVLAGLATVTDIMPLRGQNRILVVSALQLFRKHAPLGLRELLDRAARAAAPTLTARDFGFMIGPRVNAAGRLGSGMTALRLVLSHDREEARELARQVDLCNTERKSIEQGMTDEALRQVVPGAAAQVIDLPNGHPGVAGIVAARVLERLPTLVPGAKENETSPQHPAQSRDVARYVSTQAPRTKHQAPSTPVLVPGAEEAQADEPTNRRAEGSASPALSTKHQALSTAAKPPSTPVCVIAGGHGSARAPEGYNVRDAFEACADCLTRFGGHAAAGGFSVKDGCLDQFRERFAAACAAQAAKAPSAGEQLIDAWVTPADLTRELAEQIKKMEPFGEENREPVFALRAVQFADVRTLGAEGRHLQFAFRGDCPRAVWWNHGDQVEAFRAASNLPHDILFTVELSTYGEPHIELRLLDSRPSCLVSHQLVPSADLTDFIG